MNPQDTDLPDSDHPSGDVPSEAPAAPKPRRRRAVAVAAEVAAPAVDAVAPAPEPAGNLEASPKPKRTRRKAVEVVADEVGPVEGSTPAPAPAAVVVEPVVAVAPPVSIAAIEPVVVHLQTNEQPAPAMPGLAQSAEQSGAADDAGAVGDEPGTAESAADGAGGPEGQRRRNRNRRRGRRGNGDKGALPGVEIGEALVGGVTVAGSVATADDDDDDDDDAAPATPPAPLPPVDAGETFADVLSGAYDAIPAEDIEAVPERRVLAAEPDAPKLHKVLAQAGIGSRRDMEQLIADGQVTVNGQPAHTGQRISFGDQIRVQGKPVKVRIAPPLPRVIAYHKPVGEVVTNDDPQHRPTVFRRLPRLPQGKWQSVGRLDINTEGLLLFTNSGEMANQLMHPRFGVEREYAVRVLGTLDQDGRESLLEGVEIDGQRAAFKSIADGGGEGVNHWYRVVITEGRNREVRKLFDTVGLAVSRLIRIRYGCVVLPRGLKRGVYVDLNETEVRELRRMAGGRDAREGQGSQGSRPPQGHEGGGKSRRNRRGGQQGRGGDRAPDRPDRGNDRNIDRTTDRPFERREPGEGGPIPNPLQQTFDKRAIREASRQPKREYSEDGPIPNPLEQTYDKRFVQKQRGIGGGGGGGRNRGGDQGGQPDPLKTAVGYIGADAFVRKFQNNGGGGGGGGGRGGRRRGGR